MQEVKMPKVLIVDDEDALRFILQQTLEEFEEVGLVILSASNGEEGLNLIINERPDIVFLDVMMPIIDGFEVCRKVKKELGLTNIFIVILTAKGQSVDSEKSNEVGADLYLSKPFNPMKIMEIVSEKLGYKI